jgi:hypothetical protein
MSLSPSQRQVLEAALGNPERLVVHFPDHLKGGARGKVLSALHSAGLITLHQASTASLPVYAVSDAGLAALGIEPPALTPDPDHASDPDSLSAPQRMREGTKQAALMALLKKPQGASLSEMAQVSGWQAHTLRGFIAGSLKKKRGLAVTSEKAPGQERRYRIA